MQKIISTVISLMISVVAFAQSDVHHQILIFRNTGITDIVYSDNLSGIELSCFDKDSVEHDNYVSQVFKRINGDNIIVPIDEIDSVCFGPRRIIEAKPDVRRLTDEEASAILKFDDTYIVYSSGISSKLMVTPGETVYYDAMTETLPYGLCAKIGTSSNTSEGTRFDIEFLDPADVFTRYFVSENSADTPDNPGTRLTDDEVHNTITNIHLGNESSLIKYYFNAALNLGMEVSETIFAPIKHHYHAKVKLQLGAKLESELKTGGLDLQKIYEANDPISLIKIPGLGGLLSVGLEVRGFIEAVVEIALKYEYSIGNFIEFEWTRKDGKDEFSDLRITDSGKIDQQIKNEAVLNGELFVGGELDFLISGLWERTGAVAAVKSGIFANGKFGFETLSKLSKKWETELSAKATFNWGFRLQFDTYWYRNLSFGGSANRDYYELPFKQKYDLNVHEVNLFPDLQIRSTHGKVANKLEESTKPAIDLASYNDTKIEVPIKVDYQLVDKRNEEIIQEIIVKEPIEAHTEEIQQFYEEFVLDEVTAEIDYKDLYIQPVFKYAGYKVKAKPANISGDMVFSPINASMYSSSGGYFVTGMTPVSQCNKGEFTYVEGNLLPCRSAVNPYRNKDTSKIISWGGNQQGGGSSLSEDALIGTWEGHADGSDIIMTFIDDKNGTYNEIPFKYQLNKPSSGGLSLTLENGNRIVMFLINIDDTQLSVTNKAKTKIYKFNKK